MSKIEIKDAIFKLRFKDYCRNETCDEIDLESKSIEEAKIEADEYLRISKQYVNCPTLTYEIIVK